jgi:hypothetical protein
MGTVRRSGLFRARPPNRADRTDGVLMTKFGEGWRKIRRALGRNQSQGASVPA